MIENRLRVAVIIGSIRKDRFGPIPAGWIAAEASKRSELDVDVIDLASAFLPEVLGDGGAAPQAVQDLAPYLASADGFVMVTPEYNHSVPASLKNAIDWYVDEWKAKPVAFVSYGGIAGGLRAVQQLRQILPSLHATTIRDTVSFHDCWDLFDVEGQPVDVEGCNAAAKVMLDQLIWWAQALRDARAARPYDG
ncbi:NADPH-dependent FMN reductase [Amycolatopsis cihanbeyliensis]|uniref:NAD(P)H-dependent FMN reductase n=1 Tax=Amycolatopsis cihanbeyliensis TaxID=1128664 RepID=A0A542DSC8_AMYCI|nr:NAD(P)H-dependent oxidoreductase [Amycolatopsis cihanbeyliensis]TQJ05924.1 NAD(P)H-dependent FMN reductase [Amycolatopsis cihanbeyliensis]